MREVEIDYLPKWIISDTHFHHRNIFQYESIRQTWGASTPEEMTAHMICAWNEVVGKNDIVLHCGDLALGRKEQLFDLVPRLNGRILLVIGNHDRTPRILLDAGVHIVTPELTILYRGYNIHVSHKPENLPVSADNDRRIYIHGHTHSAGLHPRVPRERGICACMESLNTDRPLALQPLIDAIVGSP